MPGSHFSSEVWQLPQGPALGYMLLLPWIPQTYLGRGHIRAVSMVPWEARADVE